MNIQITDQYKRKGNLLHFLFNVDKPNKEGNKAYGYIYLKLVEGNIEDLQIELYPQYKVELSKQEQNEIIKVLQTTQTWERATKKIK